MNDVRGNNIFFPQWGCELHGLIGEKHTKLTSSKLQMMIRLSLEYLRFLQCEEHEVYRNMTSDEILLGVESINVKDLVVGYDVSVTIKNMSDEIIGDVIQLT